MTSIAEDQTFAALCCYDPRHPNFADTYDDEECPQPPRQQGCGCDNCFYGRDRLAMEVMRLRSTVTEPILVSARLPGLIEQVLIKAECALSDIAEGEAEESEGDPLEWAEKRAADALARIRPVMRQHQIRTSEWPPLPAHALPVPADD